MSVYSSGTEAYRDTTKWLTAFVPVTALASVIFIAGPELIKSLQISPSIPSWVSQYWIAFICFVVIFLGIFLILVFGSKVLSVEPTDIGDLTTTDGAKSEVARAIGAGTTAPYFFDKSAFDAAMGKVAHAWDDNTPLPSDDLDLNRVTSAVEALREWSVFRQTKNAFQTFRIVFILSIAAIFMATLIAPLQFESGAGFDRTTRVDVNVSSSGQVELRNATGCMDPRNSLFYAVGGDWRHPELAVDGPGCIFNAVWRPSPESIELRPDSSS